MAGTRKYSTATKATAVAIAATDGIQKAAKELDLPHQRVSEWLRAADSADVRLYVQAKALEAAAGVVDKLPGLLERLVRRFEETLEDPDVKWNGTQIQAVNTGFGILVDKVLLLTGGSSSGRFGTHGGSSSSDPDILVAQVLERARTQG